MARTYGKILTRIWERGSDFRTLPSPPQHLYLHLCTAERLSYAGTLDYVPDRLADLAPDLTPAKITRSVRLLEDQRYVIIDRRTSELLVRSFIRHDGLLGSPNITRAMAKAYRLIASEQLQHAVVDELRRLWKEDDQRPGWLGLRAGDPDLHALVAGDPIEEAFT